MPQLSGSTIAALEAFVLGAIVAILSSVIDLLMHPPIDWPTVGALAMGAFVTYLLAYMRGLVRLPDGQTIQAVKR